MFVRGLKQVMLLNLLVGVNLLWAHGEGSLQAPKAIEGTEIVDKRGAKFPSSVIVTNHLGEKVDLAKRFEKTGKKPLILTLGYYKCPMLCNLVMNGLVDSLKQVSLNLGKDYDVISVSINPKETADLAKTKRTNYLKSMSKDDTASWEFYVGEESEVRKLADAVGFEYKYLKSAGEYVHSAGIFVLSPSGVLSQTMYGITYEPRHLKNALIEASAGKIGSLLDRVILSCFHYDPDSHKYGVYIFGLMRLGGIVTIVLIGLMLFLFWRFEKRSRSR